jgi:HTH-type transcriptional regulator/antitoxin HipB
MDLIARNTKQLGAAIRRIRKQQGLTQSALAERMHSRQATISTLEKGEAALLRTVIDALTALNLEIVIRPRSTASLQDFLEDTA